MRSLVEGIRRAIAVVAAVFVVEECEKAFDISNLRPPGVSSRVDFCFKVLAKPVVEAVRVFNDRGDPGGGFN